MKLRIGLVTLLVIGALALVTANTAFAQEATPATPATPDAESGFRMGRHFGRGLGGQVGMEAIAEALGMTTDELSTELWGGKTLADLAEEKGVELQDLRDAVTAAQEAATRDAIEQAVEDGTITREHADWLLEGLDNGYWSGHGFHGFGGFRSFRGPSLGSDSEA
jgi:hypothetical protein